MAERLSIQAKALISEHDLRLSPVASLELAYLHEVGRARDPLATMLEQLRRDTGLEIDDVSAEALAQAAAGLSWTRDPFDRLIAAHAVLTGAPLLTADRTILEHLPQAVWD